MVRKSLLGIFLFTLLYPYLFALTKLRGPWVLGPDIALAFKNTFLQSVVSASLTLFFGFLGAMGLLTVLNKKRFSFYKATCLLPSFLPALFYILATLEVIRPFPYGFWGIVLVHVLTTMGLSAIVFYSLIANEWRTHAEIAFLEGTNVLFFLRKMLRSACGEISSIFLFFFIYFFTSFSVPLLVGHQFLTLEIFVYEKLRLTGSFNQSVLASFLEMLTMLILIGFNKHLSVAPTQNISLQEKFPILSQSIFKPLLWIPIAIYFLGTVVAVMKSIVSTTWFMPLDFLNLTLQSAQVSLGVGFLLALFFALIVVNYDQFKLQRWILAYIPLSTILFAISFSSLKGNPTLETVFALSILFFPALYRYQLKEKMDQLNAQYQTASLMGASVTLIFKKILFPQLKETIFFLSGLGAFWAIGDFAISRVIYGQESTVAIFVQNLAGQYRLEEAMVYEMVLLFMGLVIFWCISELKDVFD